MKFEDLVKGSDMLANIKPSHNEPSKVKEGWQAGLYEKEITNYSGTGPIIRVYGDTEKNAEAIALKVCEAMAMYQKNR